MGESGSTMRHFLELGHKDLDSLWRPDLHIRNLRDQLKVYSELIRLYEDGTVEMLQLVFASLELSDVWYAPYPFDHQMLTVKVESLAHTTEQITLVSLSEFSGLNFELSAHWPGWIPSGSHAVHFSAEDITPHYAHIAGNEHRCERRSRYHIDVTIERALGNVVTNHFFPLISLVIVTWTSSWISIKSLMPRVAVGFISFLTLSNMEGSFSAQLPAVSYDTWINIFFANQRLFVILSLFETAICTAITDSLSTRVGIKLDRLSRWLFPLDYTCITTYLFVIGTAGVTEQDPYMARLHTATAIIFTNAALLLLALALRVVHAYRSLLRDMRLDPIMVHLDSLKTAKLDTNEIAMLFRGFDANGNGVVSVHEIVCAVCKTRLALQLGERQEAVFELLRKELAIVEVINLEHFVQFSTQLLAKTSLIAQMSELPEIETAKQQAAPRQTTLEEESGTEAEIMEEGNTELNASS